jgi:hypothetical protein
MIQSENFVKNTSGFQIKSNRDSEFYNGAFRGRLEADEGYLNSVEIRDQAIFKGRIFSDGLIVDYGPDSTQRFPASGSYAGNTRPYTIRNAVNVFFREKQCRPWGVPC